MDEGQDKTGVGWLSLGLGLALGVRSNGRWMDEGQDMKG